MSDVQETDNNARTAQKVTIVGALVNLFLSAIKIVVGLLGHSAALVADGIHSLSDLTSDAIVLLAIRHGSQPADEEHPYGHERIETVATVILGVMLVLVAGGIAWDAVDRMLHQDELLVPGIWVIVAVVISLLSNEWLYWYTLSAARKIHSNILEANAWHHRSDAISSLVVLVGVVGAMVGMPVLDAVAAFIVGLMIVHIAWGLISASVKELVDTAVDEDTQEQIRSLINAVDGVVNLHMVRTRRMGSNILVDAHIQVNPRLSVSEGHQIAEYVKDQLIRKMAHVQDVTIHIDPEDDEEAPVNSHLPLRNEILKRLNEDWSGIPQAGDVRDIVLHYLDGKVEVELLLPLPEGGDAEARDIQAAFTRAGSRNEWVSTIRVRFN